MIGRFVYYMSMRLTRCFIVSIATTCFWLACASLACAATVTVDVAARTATGDSTTIEVPKPRVNGEQVGILVKSTVAEPQFVTIKYVGLKQQDYDIYVNKEYKGVQPGAKLEEGIQCRIDGRVVDPALVRCLSAVNGPLKKKYEELQRVSTSEAKRVCGTLSQACGWVSSGLGRDQAWRSAAVVVAPAGKVLEDMSFLTRDDEYGTARAVTTACWLLQQARDRMYRVINDPILRNDAVVALTPVDFAATYSIKNGKPHIDAKVTNNCNLPISGEITCGAPAGWKTNAKKLKFGKLESGQVFSTSFDLIGPTKAVAPDSVPVAANITVTQDIYTASLKLRVVATKQSAAIAK